MASGFVQFRKEAVQILDGVVLLPVVLLQVIVEYWMEQKWNPKTLFDWHLADIYSNVPKGLTFYQKTLYICDFGSNALLTYSIDGKAIEGRPPLLNCPVSVDIDYEILYIINKTHVTLCNLKSEILSSWPLPSTEGFDRNIKIDNQILHITIADCHQILLYTKSGNLIKKYGKEKRGNGKEEFSKPMGMGMDHTYLYVCDCYNDRIQILYKDTGRYYNDWGERGAEEGKMDGPSIIYYYLGLLYVGDTLSLSIYSLRGFCLQRLEDKKGKLYWIGGIFVNGNDEQLYITDVTNKRVQIFGKLK